MIKTIINERYCSRLSRLSDPDLSSMTYNIYDTNTTSLLILDKLKQVFPYLPRILKLLTYFASLHKIQIKFDDDIRYLYKYSRVLINLLCDLFHKFKECIAPGFKMLINSLMSWILFRRLTFALHLKNFNVIA